MKLWRNLLVVVAVLSLVGVVQAQQGAKKGAKDGKAVIGQVMSIDATGKKIVVKPKAADAKEVTVTFDDKTKVTVDGKDAKLADLKKDQYVKVTPATGTAKKIVATTEKKVTKKEVAAKKDKAAK